MNIIFDPGIFTARRVEQISSQFVQSWSLTGQNRQFLRTHCEQAYIRDWQLFILIPLTWLVYSIFQDGSTLLHYTCQAGQLDASAALIKKGVLVHMPNKVMHFS